MERTLRCGQQLLRVGLTTGTCAALAARGAARLLLAGELPREVSLRLPDGSTASAVPSLCRMEDGAALCGIIKEAGDDPDITDGIEVRVRLLRSPEGMVIEGGEGVGRVTRPGLDQPVGEAAINRVPREMIRQVLLEEMDRAGESCGLVARVEIPGGEALAQKTFNPRLGIVGGLSVLGTTGLVLPMSEEALIRSIEVALRQLREEGLQEVILTPGHYGERFLAEREIHCGTVLCSNFVGEALDACAQLGFSRVLLVGHLGKLVKLAAGIMNTHSRVADGRMEILGVYAALCGVGAPGISKILACATTQEALGLLEAFGVLPQVMARIGEAIKGRLESRLPETLRAGAVLFSNDRGVLAVTPGAGDLMREMGVKL